MTAPATVNRETVQRAEELLHQFRWGNARKLLHTRLAGLDPTTEVPDRILLDAALCYVTAAVQQPHKHAEPALPWARYAVRATTMLYPGDTTRRVTAIDALSAITNRLGHHDEAIFLAREVLASYQHGTDADGLINAQFTLAARLLDNGDCDEGIHHATTAWNTWTRHHGPVDTDGLIVAATVMAMLAGCHHHDAADEVFDQMKPAYPPPEPLIHRRLLKLIRSLRRSRQEHLALYHPDQPCAHRPETPFDELPGADAERGRP